MHGGSVPTVVVMVLVKVADVDGDADGYSRVFSLLVVVWRQGPCHERSGTCGLRSPSENA